MKLGAPQRQSGRGSEESNTQHLLGLEPPINQPVAQRCTTELSMTLYYELRRGRKFLTVYFKVLSQNFLGGTEGNRGTLQS
jgi:hypothetical protein